MIQHCLPYVSSVIIDVEAAVRAILLFSHPSFSPTLTKFKVIECNIWRIFLNFFSHMNRHLEKGGGLLFSGCWWFSHSALVQWLPFPPTFVHRHLADGRQPCQTAVAYFKHKSRGDALQAKSLAMAFSELFSCQKCRWNSNPLFANQTAM